MASCSPTYTTSHFPHSASKRLRISPDRPRYLLVLKRKTTSFSVNCKTNVERNGEGNAGMNRRDVLVTPLLAIGAYFARSMVARADDDKPAPTAVKAEVKIEDVVTSRIYDATVIGEPLAVGKDKSRIWEKVMNARIVYLGEAEQVPVKDDKDLELEIVKTLWKNCVEKERTLSLAFEAFPCNLQEQLNQYVDKRYN